MADEDGLAAPFDNYLTTEISTVAFQLGGRRNRHTFLPKGMAAKSISTLACASTSAEADILTRKSTFKHDCQPSCPPTFPIMPYDVFRYSLGPIVDIHLVQ